MSEEHPWVRDVGRGDLPAISALLAVTDVHRAFGWCEPPGALDLGALMFPTSACARRYNRTWLLGLRCGVPGPQIAVGLCNVRGEEQEMVDVAYALAPAARGTGRMRAFMRLVLPQLFAESGVLKVFANVAEDNLASRRTLHALGFTPRTHQTFALARDTFLGRTHPTAGAAAGAPLVRAP